ncbi:winged helix-turn-helix transcriptional regulator [Salicibibacter cibarius]|uniref:Winged helix-turn-helix transcriptional regulator n=1 Tax=Salicibibacter cibarius TaxID=2743000 RepID=A0A7T6Z3F0_9BACI|nr:metalloregulator ArsR/SmtB family transcription factor [Salicibibacter cibarius]QQK76290.1 winged helix-turn-helix transcriptional regulator [Salicibibacter cibarius]
MGTSTIKLSSTKVANCIKVISDPTRLLMMKLVEKKEYCVCQFVDMFGMSQPAASQHLRKLREAGLVKENRRGQWRFYSMNESSPEASIVKGILSQIDEKDDQYRQLLEREAPVDCQ